MPEIIFCHASWCPPCRQAMKNLIVPLQEAGYGVLLIDAEESPTRMEKMGVDRLPTLLLISEDDRQTFVGRMPTVEEVKHWYDSH